MEGTGEPLLKNARFLRLWAGQGISLVGDFVAMVILVVELSGSASAVARLLPTLASPRPRILRSEDAVHGIEGFIAVPIGPEGGERWGAIVLGGVELLAAEDDDALKLLTDAVAPALAGAGDAPAGREPVTDLPNRSSLYRVLGSRLSADRTLTVLVAGLDGLRSYGRTHGPDAGDELLRRVGRRLGEAHPRVFRSADAEFVVVLSGAGAPKAREAALTLRRLASEAMGPGGASGASGVSVGFVSVGAGEGEPELVMDAAARPRRGQGTNRGRRGFHCRGRGRARDAGVGGDSAGHGGGRGAARARTSGSIPGPSPGSRTS